MPSPNTIKYFAENHYYHVFNRGVEKRRIFEDAQDYEKFLYYLKTYLTPLEILRRENPLLRSNLAKNNLSQEVDLIAFCLMPNHFHLLLQQKTKDGISKLMKQLTTAYSMYFNKRYERIGPLFQGIYKACTVENDQYLLHLSRYIHLNAAERVDSLGDFRWSSYPIYTGKESFPWLKPQIVLDFFNQNNSNLTYEGFVEKEKADPTILAGLTLETD